MTVDLARLEAFLRNEGRSRPDADSAENDWCEKMTAAANSIAELRVARLRARQCDAVCGAIQHVAAQWYRAETEFDIAEDDPYEALRAARERIAELEAEVAEKDQTTNHDWQLMRRGAEEMRELCVAAADRVRADHQRTADHTADPDDMHDMRLLAKGADNCVGALKCLPLIGKPPQPRVTDEAVHAVALAVRRRTFERTGRIGIFDPDVQPTDAELDNATAALKAALKVMGKI